MKQPLSFRLALAVLLAAPAVGASAEPAQIDPKQVLPGMERKLTALRAKAEKEIKDPAARQKALDLIGTTSREFVKHKQEVEGRPAYQIEEDYFAGAFDRLVLKPCTEGIKLMKTVDSPLAMPQLEQAMLKKSDEAVQREEGFRTEFYNKNKKEIEEIVGERQAQRRLFLQQRSTMQGEWRPNGAWGGRGGQGADDVFDPIDGTEDMPPGMDKFERTSPIIRAGKYSIAVANGTLPPYVPPKPPGAGSGDTGLPPVGTPTLPGGTNSAPNQNAPGAPNASFPSKPGAGSSPSSEPSWSDLSHGAVTSAAPAGVNAAASEALQSGDYATALRLAGRAMELNPGDKDARAVYEFARGRAPAGSAPPPPAFGPAAGGSGGQPGAGGFARSEAASSFSLSAGVVPSSPLTSAARLAEVKAAVAQKMGMRDSDAALSILNVALEKDPTNPTLLAQRSQVYTYLGRFKEALADAKAGLSAPGAEGNVVLLKLKARSENRLGFFKDALATSNAILAQGSDAEALAYRAHAYGGLGNKDAMLADLKAAASIDPRFKDTLAQAESLQLPSDSDVLFLFPGETAPKKAEPAPAPSRSRSSAVVAAVGVGGGVLLALGLLSMFRDKLKTGAESLFTRRTPATDGASAAAASVPALALPSGPGVLIRGQYEILKQIGAGGMGMVYEGTDRSLGRRVAIKKMRDELRASPRDRERFVIEAKTVAALHHPNIVDIYAIAEEGEDVYLVFEYVDGRNVHDVVQAQGRLRADDAARLTRAVADALTYAHSKGVIHRDVKPSNIMISSNGVKVMDFGIARMAKDAMTRYSMTNTVVGTPPYMAPEQEQGVVRKESDVYALAVCAYELLTGKLPFAGIGAGMLLNKINMSYIPPSRAAAGLPEALDEVFAKGFQAQPDARWRTPAEFAGALEAALGAAKKA